jgi:hypothetical protein
LTAVVRDFLVCDPGTTLVSNSTDYYYILYSTGGGTNHVIMIVISRAAIAAFMFALSHLTAVTPCF